MNELKELDEIENLCERIYNSGSDDNSYRFNECVESIMQLIETYTAKAIVEELGHIQVNYGHYVAQTMAGGEWQTIKERMIDLSNQRSLYE